jgi:UDP-N-acetylglucosamine acyltransferase
MASHLHPTAIVDPGAELGADVEIGPYCVIGPKVKLGDRCILRSHVVLDGPSEIGPENEFFPFCSIGAATQDLKYSGEPTYLRIGQSNRFREFVTINRGTSPGEWTIVGSFNNLLAYAHIAHNCVVGNHCIFSNNGTLAGHVIMEDYAIIGGLSAVHQFCRIGRMSLIGGCTKIVQDLPPYTIGDGNPAEVRSLNLTGLKRNGIPDAAQRALREAFKLLYRPEYNTSQALDAIEAESSLECEEVRHLLTFCRASQRGIIR